MTYFEHLGIQLYTLRDAYNQDAENCLRKIAEIGYKEVEYHSIALLGNHAQLLKELGLKVSSSHFMPPYLTGKWEAYGLPKPEDPSFQSQLDLAAEHGVEHLVMPMLLPQERGNLDHYKGLAELFNSCGERCNQLGIKFCYHHHNFEFEPLEGFSPMELFLEQTDADLVSFELDIFWVAVAGKDPIEFMKKYGDRIKLLHLKDLKAGVTPNFNTIHTAMNMPEIFLEVGNGVLDIKRILQLAREIGITHAYVEQDSSPDPMRSVKTSYQFLEELGL
ncbi:MAG: sugar phosphate isomerase/epimerase [Bacteroidota bacterium]